MRKAILLAVLAAVLFAPVAFAQGSESYYGGSFSRMSFIKGDVYVQHGQDAAYEQGELNLVVQEGDKIGTKNGRLELQLGRRNYLRLGDDTQVDIVTLPRQGGDRTKLHLLAGRAFLRVAAMDGEKNFEIHTPDASFYILESGLYRIEVRENRQTEFAVLSGSAEAAGAEGSVVVNAREQVTAENGRLVSSPGSLIAGSGDFDDWNASRDAVFARTPSQTYLPADYSDYEGELADNGRWVNEAEYGNVWVPNVSSYSDWRPYYYGHWSWYPIIGWTWASDESWGWCTSHYGRWGWGSGLGWYWIPERSWGWGPAWVSWYGYGDYIGWCPLSYYGYPGVLMNGRFYGRYSDRYYPNRSMAMTVVHRDQLQNRRLSNTALDRNGMGRLGNMSMSRMQPEGRSSFNANGDVANRARQALSRDGLRSVNQSFSTGRRLSSDMQRSSSRSTVGAMGADRNIQSSSGDISSRSLSRGNTGGTGSAGRQAVERGTYLPRVGSGSSSSSSQLRSFPSRMGSGNATSGSGITSRSRDTVSRSTIRSFPSRRSGGEGGTSMSSPSRNGSSSSPSYSSPSRTYSAPSRSYSSPSRNSRSSSPSYSSPSRTYSAPSRSYSAPSHSYSAPSRSSGSSSSSGSLSRSSSGGGSSRSSGSSSGGHTRK